MVENKIEVLREELNKLNNKFPSNVYIPFVTKEVREYIVLSIPTSEAKIFVTKDKVPYLIAVEVFDPLEIAYDPIFGTILPKPSAGKLPAPKSPEKAKGKTGLNRKQLLTPEEEEQKEMELILNIHFNPKAHDKNHKRNQAITINQVKLQNNTKGIFINKLLVEEYKSKFNERQKKIKEKATKQIEVINKNNLLPNEEEKDALLNPGGKYIDASEQNHKLIEEDKVS